MEGAAEIRAGKSKQTIKGEEMRSQQKWGRMRTSGWAPPHLPWGPRHGSEQRQESLPEFDLLLGGRGVFSLHCHVQRSQGSPLLRSWSQQSLTPQARPQVSTALQTQRLPATGDGKIVGVRGV